MLIPRLAKQMRLAYGVRQEQDLVDILLSTMMLLY
jgi:hypothetical protein